MALRSTELMIGDWVYQAQFEDATKPYTGHGWKPTKVTSIPFDKDYFLEPIPLTTEILEKNGFILIDKKDKYYRWEYAEGIYVNADFKSEEPWVSIHNECYYATPVCRYIHELQHALRLCGIEKEIIL